MIHLFLIAKMTEADGIPIKIYSADKQYKLDAGKQNINFIDTESNKEKIFYLTTLDSGKKLIADEENRYVGMKSSDDFISLNSNKRLKIEWDIYKTENGYQFIYDGQCLLRDFDENLGKEKGFLGSCEDKNSYFLVEKVSEEPNITRFRTGQYRMPTFYRRVFKTEPKITRRIARRYFTQPSRNVVRRTRTIRRFY